MDVFFIGFAIYYLVNSLFFNDETMHKIYESKGKFDLEYQIVQIGYSSLISILLDTILKYLALSNNGIIELKKNRTKKNVDKRKTNLESNLRIKFVLFFIIGFLVLLAIWYYIAMFGVIYANTQMHLLKDTLISFGSSLISPFFIYILPTIFRVPSLAKSSKARKCCYNFSKLLQLF